MLGRHSALDRFRSRLQQAGAPTGHRQPIPARPVGRASEPLSYDQERLWFLERLQPELSVYTVPMMLRLRGRLDLDALRWSVTTLIRRHEVLRTVFTDTDGEPRQVIRPPAIVDLPILHRAGSSDSDSVLADLVRQEQRRHFDLAVRPPMRAKVVRFTLEDHALLFTVHHIAADGWSLRVIHRELADLYAARAGGEPPRLAELPLQFADYAVWQRQPEQQGMFEAQVQFWRSELAQAPTVLELPADRERPATPDFRCAVHELVLPAELTRRVRELGQAAGTTMFMTAMAGFQVLLSRYTRQEDLIVGTLAANRGRPELEPLIGFFVNTLALRADLRGVDTVRDLLARVRTSCLGAFEHQELPFGRLVEELAPARMPGRTPMIQAVCALRDPPADPIDAAGLIIGFHEPDEDMTQFELTAELLDDGSRLRGFLKYRTSLFEQDTIARMARHWRNLLAGMVADPGGRVADLVLTDADERQRVVIEPNQTTVNVPGSLSVHEAVARHAAERPDTRAASCGEAHVTYRELNARVNGLAGVLTAAGAGPEHRVAVLLEPSIEFLVAVLAVMRSGAAFVPLDTDSPRARLALMVSDSGASIVLTDSRGTAALGPVDVEVHCLDRLSDAAPAPPACVLRLGNLAYVMFTSGSTGRPKAVAVSQAGLANYLWWARHVLLPDPVHPVVSKVTFDVVLTQLFLPLLSGTAVWLIPREVMAEPAELARQLANRGTPNLYCTPSLCEALLDMGDSAALTTLSLSLTRVILAGERLDRALVDRLHTRFPSAEVWNAYGPTEITTIATAVQVDRSGQRRSRVPIGRAIWNDTAYVLDTSLNPTPIAVPGELYIGGSGVARGYLGQPAITAEKFIPDPFGTQPGARLYRTGDLARYLSDGTLEFLGRIDHQVKIRGFRIEPGEIENVLRQHPDVRQAAVTTHTHHGDLQLAAYVTGVSDDLAEVARSHLVRHLPDYMVPATITTVDRIPMTPNGKVDYRGLPAPQRLRQRHVPPRTPTEHVLHTIFSAILGTPEIGIHDNFFHLGGHSILAARLISRIATTLGVEIPVRTVFDHPTIAELFTAIVEHSASATTSEQLNHALAQLSALPEAPDRGRTDD